MTRQEAVETLKMARAEVEWEYPMDYAVAFDMAIKELSKNETDKMAEIKLLQAEPNIEIEVKKALEDVRAEINRNGLWVSYKIEGHNDSDIDKLIGNVLKQAKRQVIDVINKHIEERGKMKTIKCDECGKEFEVGSRPDGLPNGVGFQLEDGTIWNVCAECIVKIGKELKEDEE